MREVGRTAPDSFTAGCKPDETTTSRAGCGGQTGADRRRTVSNANGVGEQRCFGNPSAFRSILGLGFGPADIKTPNWLKSVVEPGIAVGQQIAERGFDAQVEFS